MHDTENFKKNIHEDYDIEEELGSGQFAVVRKIVEKETGDEFAAKYVRKKRTKASRNGMSREDIKREIEILRMVDSEKIIKVHDVYETDKEVILVMELLRGGELFDYISKKDFLTEEEAIDFTRQILQGLQHLHSRSVVHLDLKPENILLKNTRRKTIKLVDFGLARVVNENEQVREIMGTPEFVAPEVLNFDTISTATDMWALGVIAYILLSGASPFLGEDNQETFTNIIQVDYQFDEEYFAEISDEAKDFIRKLLVKNPRKRPTAHDCSRHTWVEEEVVDKKKKQRRRTTQICTFNFKRFVARKRWKMSYNKIRAMNLIAKMGIKPPPGFITAIPPMTDNNKETNNEPEPAEEKPPNSHKDHKKKESTIHRKKHKQSSSPKTAVEKTDSLTLKTMDIDIGEGESAEPEPELVDDNETDDKVELSPAVQEPVDYGSMTKREKRRARGQLRTDEIAKSKKEVDAKQTKIETDEVINGDVAADQVFNNGGKEATDQVVNGGEKATDQVVNGGEKATDQVVNNGEEAADQVVNGGEGAADQVVSGVKEAAMVVEETAPADEKPVETKTVTSTMHIEHKPQSGGILKKGGRGGRIPSTEDHYFVTLNAALLQQDDTFYHSGLQPTRKHGHGILKHSASTPPDVTTKDSEEKSAPKGSGYVRKRSEDVPKSTEDVPKPSENKKVSQFTTVVQVNSGGNAPQDDKPGSGVLVGLQVDKAVAHAPDKETANEMKPEVPKTEVKPSHHNSDSKKAPQVKEATHKSALQTKEATPPPKRPLTNTDNPPQQRSFTPPPWQRKSSRENLKATPPPIHGVSKVSLKANRFVSNDKQPSPKSPTNAGSVKTSNVLGKSKLFQKETNKPDIKKTAATKTNSGQELKNVACDINLDDTPAKNGAVEIHESKARADSQSKGRSDSQSKVGSDIESKLRSNSQLKVLSNGQTKPRSDSQSKTRSGSVKTDNIKNKNNSEDNNKGSKISANDSRSRSNSAQKVEAKVLNGENAKKSINNAVQSSVEIPGGNEEQEAGTEVNEELTSLSTHSLTEFTIRPRGNSGEEKAGEEKAGGFDIMLTIAPPTDQPTQEPRAVSTMKTRFTSSSSSLPDPRSGLSNGKLTSLSTNDMTSLSREPVTSPTTDRHGVAQGSKYTPQRDFSKYLNNEPSKPIKVTGIPANTQKPSWQVKRNSSPATVITPAKTINNPKSPTTPTVRPLSFAAKSAAAKVSVAYVPRRSFGFTTKTGNQSEMVAKPSEPEEAPKLNNNDESKRWSQTSYTSDRSASSASSDELSLSNVTDENTALNRAGSNEQISKNPEICRKIENHSGKLSPNASPVLQKKWKATLVLPKESEKVPSGKDRDIRISSTNAPRKNKFTNVRSMWEKK